MVWLRGTSWSLVMQSGALTEGRGRLGGPRRKTSPNLAVRDPKLTRDGGRGVLVSPVHRASPELLPDTPCPRVAPLFICWDKNLLPSTRHSRWKPLTMAASGCPPPPRCHTTNHLYLGDLPAIDLGLEAKHGKGPRGHVPTLNCTCPRCSDSAPGTFASHLPCTLSIHPVFLSIPRAAGGQEWDTEQPALGRNGGRG